MPLPSPRFLLRPGRRSSSLGLALGALGLLLPALRTPARAQDLVGCQLVEGQLQCVPGVTADPQQQIKILEGQITADQQLQGAVQQQIAGLNQLVLQGQALEGGLLQASLKTTGMAVLPASSYHWYRSVPGSRQWQLILNAKGTVYALTSSDVGNRVMVVVAVPTAQGSQRSASTPVGPVQPKGSRPSPTPCS